MPDFRFENNLKGKRIHLVGAKGTGMTALAEILAARGAALSGSDLADSFYTDDILARIGLEPAVGFEPAHLAQGTDLVLYSDAYRRDQNPELLEAAARGLPVMSFAEALGELSRACPSSAVCGVHGKTTTTAMAGSILKELGARATVLAGSAVSSFGGSCVYLGGTDRLVAETDEYRGHFLHFSPSQILLTSVESDHQDYYPTYGDIRSAFVAFLRSLPPRGRLVYCADDPGAVETANLALESRPDLRAEAYGFAAGGRWRIAEERSGEGFSRFRLGPDPRVYEIHVPGRHLVQDAAGAVALASGVEGEARGDGAFLDAAARALAGFRGSKRRSEVLGEAGGVLFLDDYAHHPTALRATIAGFRRFWPSRRLVVDFMSHTYSRTKALLDDFAASFGDADCLVLHEIYASAREAKDETVSGRQLFERARDARPDLIDLSPLFAASSGGVPGRAELAAALGGRGFILYVERHGDAAGFLSAALGPGDLFATMGAGDNWKLGAGLLAGFRKAERGV